MRSSWSFVLLSAALALTGCRTTLHLDSRRARHPFDGGSQPVYVTNPAMHPEYEILKASHVYPLTDQTNGARRLTLQPMRHYGDRIHPILLTALTLGVIPGALPAQRS